MVSLYPGVEESMINVGPVEVRYFDTRTSGSGRTILLLHGTSGSTEQSFWTLFPMLAMKHRVVALDFVDTDDPYSPTDGYLAQVIGVLEAASPDSSVDLVGYSFGAVIAAMVAASQPGRVSTLTLVGGWLKTDDQQRLRNDIWSSLHTSQHEALPAFTALTNFSSSYLRGRTSHELAGLLSSVVSGPDRAAKMRFNRDVDLSEAVAGISAPTLVVGCTDDQTVPIHHSYMLFGAISDARLLRVDAGHGVMAERPSEVFVAIDRFVRDPHAVPAGSFVQNDHA